MTTGQMVFGCLIIAGLLAAGLGFGYVQVAALRRLRNKDALPDEERRFEQRRAWLRLSGCVLMALMALLMAVQLAYTESPAQGLAEEREALGPARPEFNDTERQFLRVWGGIWVALLLALFVVVVLTAVEMFANRARVLTLMRRLQADRRSMIMRQVGRMREQRDDTPMA